MNATTTSRAGGQGAHADSQNAENGAEQRPRGESARQNAHTLIRAEPHAPHGAHGRESGRSGRAASGTAASSSARQDPLVARANPTFQAQLSRGVRAALTQRNGSVTVRLQPQSLGQVRIEMNLKGDTISAKFDASTPEARDLLTRHLVHLRGTLESKGLQVDRLHVQLADHPEPAPTFRDVAERNDAMSDDGRDENLDGHPEDTSGRGRGAEEQPFRGPGERRGEPTRHDAPGDEALVEMAFGLGLDAVA